MKIDQRFFRANPIIYAVDFTLSLWTVLRGLRRLVGADAKG
ncbi:hypothetical protein Thiosp_04677 [Thiorhodovibrio litoralis]|nr:hypothetical protein Thiosp_04677 [Thiorhodovibrio litoralis]